jgi:hypothetical protein
MSAIKQNRAIVALKLPLPVPQLIKTAQAIVAAMTGNPAFPSPNPPLPTTTGSIATLATAETATQARTKGTAEARNAARTALLSELHVAKSYVQQVADASPDQAEAIITSAGMHVAKSAARTKAPFAVKLGPVSGSVHLAAKAAARRASYDWEWSGDGGKTWTLVPSTLQAKTSITGLPVGTIVLFRYRAVTKTGEGDWVEAISALVK